MSIMKQRRMETMEFDNKLLEILACPKCKGDLELVVTNDALDCRVCKLRYPIREGIPVMLIEEAEKID